MAGARRSLESLSRSSRAQGHPTQIIYISTTVGQPFFNWRPTTAINSHILPKHLQTAVQRALPSAISLMAAFMSEPQNLYNPHQPANVPQDERIRSTMNSASHSHHPSQQRHGPRGQNRVSGDYRPGDSNGLHMGANGREAMPVPSGPHNQMGNGQLRQMSTMSGAGAFEGARSPPGNKSMYLYQLEREDHLCLHP